MTARVQLKKSLLLNLKVLDAKTNWLAVNRQSLSNLTSRARAHQGNWQPQCNHNFRELLSDWVEHVELNGAAQIEETAAQLQRNSRKTEKLNYQATEQAYLLIVALLRSFNFFLICIVGGGIKVHSTLRPPNGLLWQGKSKYSEKTCPSAALSTTNPTCCPYANPGRRCGKPASNRWATARPCCVVY
jgi:hypothetical protein